MLGQRGVDSEFITVLEFYIGAVLALILVPFGVNRHTAFMAERAFGLVIAFGTKLMVLGFIIQRRKPRPLGVVRDNRLCLTKVFGPKHWFSTWAGIAPIPIEAERTVISTFIS